MSLCAHDCCFMGCWGKIIVIPDKHRILSQLSVLGSTQMRLIRDGKCCFSDSWNVLRKAPEKVMPKIEKNIGKKSKNKNK